MSTNSVPTTLKLLFVVGVLSGLGTFAVFSLRSASAAPAGKTVTAPPTVPEAILAPAQDSKTDAELRALYDDPVRFEQLSGAFRTKLERRFGRQSVATPVSEKSATFNYAPSSLVVPNVLVNNNANATGTGSFTQSNATVALGAGSNIITVFNDSGSNAGNTNKFTGFSTSSDSGAHWTDGGTLPTNVGGDAGDPVLARNTTTGRIYLSTVGFNVSTVQVFRSDDNGVTWSAPVNGSPGGDTEDKEWIVVDNFAGAGNGNVYLVARNFNVFGGEPDGIYFFKSTDNGATFGPNGGTAIALAGVAQGAFVAVGPDHSVYVFWFNGPTIQMRRSTDFGANFGAPVTVASGLVGGANGDLGLTGIQQGTVTDSSFRTNEYPQAAVNPVNGRIYVTYDNKGSAGFDKADVFFVQSSDSGATWSAPVKVNSDATANDQWMPTIAVTPDGARLMIGWYDRRNDSVNNFIERWGRIGIANANSVVFLPDFAISPQFLPEFGRDNRVNSVYMGDYDQMAADNNFFYTAWGDNRDDLTISGGPPRKDPNVRFAQIPTGSNSGPVFVLGSTVVGGGNGDGNIDRGETDSLTINLINAGGAAATNISVVLSTATPGVTITQPNSNYSDLNTMQTGANLTPFQLSVAPNITCGTSIAMTVAINFTGGSQTVPLTLQVGCPDLVFVAQALSGGNGNNIVEPNECNLLNVTLHNDGTGAATGITATLTTATPGVVITQPTSAYASINPAQTGVNLTPFQISTLPSFVCGSNVALTLTVNYNGDLGKVVNLTLPGFVADYNFTTATGQSIVPGTTLVAGSQVNDATVSISLPFTYNFYGQNFAAVNVSTNGNLQFTSNNHLEFNNICLPESELNNAILAYWDHLTLIAPSGIYTSTSGAAPNRIFNIEWRGATISGNVAVNFEVRLYEGQSKFDLIYAAVSNGGASATVGVQRDTGSSFKQFSCNTNSLSAGLMITGTFLASCPAGGGQCAEPGLHFYPLARPVRILDTRAGQGNCDNVAVPITGGTSITTLARLTCEGITIPDTAKAITGNVTVLNQTNQIGYMTVYPDGQTAPVAANMIYAPNDILSNNFTVGLSTDGKFNVFGERTIHVVIDVSGYYAPPGTGGLYYHALSKPVRLLDTRANQGNCDNVATPIQAGTSITTLARVTCEGVTIPTTAQAIVGNATVINGSGQLGYLTIYPSGVAVPLAANLIYFPGQILSNAFTVSLDANGQFNIFGEKTIDIAIDVAGYYSNEANDANGAGLLLRPLARPLRILDTRANQGNCDNVAAPITGGSSIAAAGRLTCESLTIPAAAQAILGNVTVINQTSQLGFLTLYPDGVAQPLAANMIYFPNQILSNAFVVGLNAGTGQFRIFAERTLDAVIDISGYFAP